jgi:hypothetical protein
MNNQGSRYRRGTGGEHVKRALIRDRFVKLAATE